MPYPEVTIYRHPNPGLRSFFTSEEISSFRVEHFKKPLNRDSEETLKSLGHIGARLVYEIMDIPHIKEIRIKPKEILLKKEESSSWEEIEEKVTAIIYRAFRRKRIKVIKD